jgi:hypothetical protein
MPSTGRNSTSCAARFRYLAIVLLLIAVVLQTGATSSVKAIKMSAKLAVGKDLQASAAAFEPEFVETA